MLAQKKKSLCSEIGVETQVKVKTQGVFPRVRVGGRGLNNQDRSPALAFLQNQVTRFPWFKALFFFLELDGIFCHWMPTTGPLEISRI